MSVEVAVMAVDGGALPLGGGLLALVRPALDELQHGGVLAVLSRAATVRQDLPSWCRAERHRYLNIETLPGGIDRHLIERGSFSIPTQTGNDHERLAPNDAKLTASDVMEV